MLSDYWQKFANYDIIWYNIFITKEVVNMDTLLIILYVLILVIFALCGFAVMQIRLAGLTVKDFWSFIEANQYLDKLYRVANRYESMSQQEQVIFLIEAEKLFRAFDKVPDMLWEEEYNKYTDVLNKYKDIKILRWNMEHEEKVAVKK